MKRTLIPALLFFLSFFCVRAQKNAFVLIDVSGNPLWADASRVTKEMHKEAEELVKQLLLGKYNASASDANWRLSGNTDPLISTIVKGAGQPLIEQGGHLLIMPFGAKDTYEGFKINRVNQFPSDIDTYWKMPASYTDANTFGEIAKAKAADIAIDANLVDYYLIMIYGLGEDTDSNLYSPREIDYLDNYKSAVIVNSLAIFRHKKPGSDFKIEISHIDIKKLRGSYQNTTNQNKVIQPQNVDYPSLEIITPKGTRSSPFRLKSESVLVSWTCLGCEENTSYTIRLSSIDKRNKGLTKKIIGRYNYRLTPDGDGKYKITVSAGGGLTSSQYFELTTSGGGGSFIGLLLLIVLIVLGYWAYQRFIKNGVDTQVGNQVKGQDIPRRPPANKTGDSNNLSADGSGFTEGSDGDYF